MNWVILFSINNKFIYCKQQQQLQRLVWMTLTTKSQMPYGFVFIRPYFVREQFCHANKEGTTSTFTSKMPEARCCEQSTWTRVFKKHTANQNRLHFFKRIIYVSVEPGEIRNVKKCVCFFVWGNFPFHHFSNWTVCNENALTTVEPPVSGQPRNQGWKKIYRGI